MQDHKRKNYKQLTKVFLLFIIIMIKEKVLGAMASCVSAIYKLFERSPYVHSCAVVDHNVLIQAGRTSIDYCASAVA